MITKHDEIEFVEKFNSPTDLSSSGRYFVRSNNQLIWVSDFNTQKILLYKKVRAYFLCSITADERYCLFTSDGEKRIRVLTLIDLNEVASLRVGYVSELKFISNEEVMFFETNSKLKLRTLKIWSFKTGVIESVFSYPWAPGNDDIFNGFFDGLDFCYVEKKANETKMSYQIWQRGHDNKYVCKEFVINNIDNVSVRICSTIRKSKLLFAKKTNNPREKVAWIYDTTKKSFKSLIQCDISELCWLSDDMILVRKNKAYSPNDYGTYLININGEIIEEIDEELGVLNCSNDNYVILGHSGFEYHLYKKQSLEQSEPTEKPG